MNVLLLRNRRGFAVVLGWLAAVSPVAAQRVVSDGMGAEYRSRGDTIPRRVRIIKFSVRPPHTNSGPLINLQSLMLVDLVPYLRRSSDCCSA